MFSGLVPVYNKKLRLAEAEKALSKTLVKSLTTEDREVQNDDECCAICIEPYEVSETLRSLPCRHGFHQNCIDPWLFEHHTCPMCKMDIVKYYDQSTIDSPENIRRLEIDAAITRLLSGAWNPILPSENSHEEAGSEHSSRASSPEELVPSLARTCDSPRHVNRSSTSSPSGSRQEAATSSTAQDSAGVSPEP